MLLSDAIKIRIEYYLKENNMKLWQLYKKSGIPKSTIYAFMKSSNVLPKLDTLHHICEGFGITIKEFFDDEMFEETEQD
ncbi:MAG: helix-turn-helix transcriptional regulator [Clostridia bacterium]|nr:helix-turn-helix transcriptional regulator [Clostridia bacterium]